MNDHRMMAWLEMLASEGGYHEGLPEMEGTSREERLALTDELLTRGWVDATANRGDDRLLSVRRIRVTASGQAALAEALRKLGAKGPSTVSVDEKRKLRFQFMKALYDATDGSRTVIVNMFELGAALGWDRDRVSNVVEYLEGEGLLEHRTLGGGISIAHSGVLEVERAVTEPTLPTEHFPPLSVIYVGTMIGSQISQGSPGSSQTLEVSRGASLDEVAALLRELKEIVLPAADFSEQDRSEFEAELGTVEQQIRSSRPKRTFIRASLTRLAEMLGHANAAAGSAVQFAEYAQRIHEIVPGI